MKINETETIETVETENEVETFTAEQVAEKETNAKNSVFSELGIDANDKEKINAVKEFISKYGKEENADEDKNNEKDEQIAEAEKQRMIAESKVEAMTSGAKSQFVDEIVILALAKADGKSKTDIKTAIAEIKAKFPDMFVSTSFDKEEEKKKDGEKGTGSSVNGKSDNGNANKAGIGKRLGANRRNQRTKVTYWN